MTKYEYRAIGLSVLAAAVGLLVAVMRQEGHWFGRSGAVVTVIAIVFASLKLSDRVAKAPAVVHKQLQKQSPDSKQMFISGGLNQADAEEAVQLLQTEVTNEVSKAVDDAIRRLLRVEVYILIVGTLLWGFGDLPLDAYFKRESANQSVQPTPTGAANVQC